MKFTKRDAETIGATIAHLLESNRFPEASGTLEEAINAASRNDYDYKHYEHPGEIPLGALDITSFMLNRLEDAMVNTIADAEKLGNELLEVVDEFGEKSLAQLQTAIQAEKNRYLKWRATGKVPERTRTDPLQTGIIGADDLRIIRKGLQYLIKANQGTVKRIGKRASTDRISSEISAAESAIDLVDTYLKKQTCRKYQKA